MKCPNHPNTDLNQDERVCAECRNNQQGTSQTRSRSKSPHKRQAQNFSLDHNLPPLPIATTPASQPSASTRNVNFWENSQFTFPTTSSFISETTVPLNQSFFEGVDKPNLFEPINRLQKTLQEQVKEEVETKKEAIGDKLDDIINAAQELETEIKKQSASLSQNVSLSPTVTKFITNQLIEEATSPDYTKKNFNIVKSVKNLFVNKERVENELEQLEPNETLEVDLVSELGEAVKSKEGALKLVRKKAVKSAVKAGRGIINAATSQATQDIAVGALKGAIHGIPIIGAPIAFTGEAIVNNISRNIRERANKRIENMENLVAKKRQSLLLIKEIEEREHEDEEDEVIEKEQSKILEMEQEWTEEQNRIIIDILDLLTAFYNEYLISTKTDKIFIETTNKDFSTVINVLTKILDRQKLQTEEILKEVKVSAPSTSKALDISKLENELREIKGTLSTIKPVIPQTIDISSLQEQISEIRGILNTIRPINSDNVNKAVKKAFDDNSTFLTKADLKTEIEAVKNSIPQPTSNLLPIIEIVISLVATGISGSLFYWLWKREKERK